MVHKLYDRNCFKISIKFEKFRTIWKKNLVTKKQGKYLLMSVILIIPVNYRLEVILK